MDVDDMVTSLVRAGLDVLRRASQGLPADSVRAHQLREVAEYLDEAAARVKARGPPPEMDTMHP